MKCFKMMLSALLILCLTSKVILAEPYKPAETYIPTDGEPYYIGSSWGSSTNKALGIAWYENPTDDANRWEAFILPLRIIEAANARLNTPIVLEDKDMLFKYLNNIDPKTVQDINFMIKIGVLSGSNNEGFKAVDPSMNMGEANGVTLSNYSNFNFEKNVTRAEIAKILSVYNDYYFKINAKRDFVQFSDIENHWATPYVTNVYTAKIANGNPDGTFDPDKNITKEQLVQMLYNCLESSNITPDDVVAGIRNTYQVGPWVDDNFVAPSNMDQYPYFKSNVDKAIYERPYIVNRNMSNQDHFENPSLVYFDLKKDLYDRVTRGLVQYYNMMINVDYNTVSDDKYYRLLKDSTVYILSEETTKNYLNYIKENKVTIKGTATFQEPIVYYDNANYRVRLKLDLNIESGGAYTNLLLLDSEQGNVTQYQQGNNVIYIDAPAVGAYGTTYVYPLPRPIFTSLTLE